MNTDGTIATKYILSMPFDAKFVPVINELATQIGLYESLVLQQVSIWLKSSSHIHDGKYWIYKTAKEMQEESFSYLSEETVRRTLQSLETMGYILVGNFNKVGFDRTKWYAIEPDKCSSLLGVFVNDITPEPSPIPQIGEWGGLGEKPFPIPQIGGTIPESLNTNTDRSTYLLAGFAAAFSAMPKAVVERETAVPISTVYTVTTVAPAPEPNLRTPYRRIIVTTEPEGADESVEEVVDAKALKAKKKEQDRLEKQAISRAFGISPTAYGSICCYKGMIFGTCKVTGMWKDCQLSPPATLAEFKKYEKYADSRCEEKSCDKPTSPATIQRWFEDFRISEKPIEQKVHPALLQKQAVVLPGDKRRTDTVAAVSTW